MKKLITLTIIALVTVAASSGCRTYRSMFNKGGACNTCDAGGYDTYGSSIVYEGDTLLPPPTTTTTIMPGPAPTSR